MGMPVMTKFYQLTKDVKYLTKMHEYFLFSLELMYDGENGIPTNENGYTSSAYVGGPYGGKKATVSNFSNQITINIYFIVMPVLHFQQILCPENGKTRKISGHVVMDG